MSSNIQGNPPSATLNLPDLVAGGTIDINNGPEAPELTDTCRIEPEGGAFADGAFSDVFKGIMIPIDGSPPREVAIKVYRLAGAHQSFEHKKAIARMAKYLSREVYVWQRLQHKRITPLLGFMRTTPFVDETSRSSVVTPFYKNGNLVQWLRSHPDTDRMALLVQAAEGVAYLHSLPKPIAHLDIKPDNILINNEEEAELCDFGISKVVEEIAPTQTSTSGQGTVRFQAPEFLNDTHRTTKADVWAFGGLIIYTLSGMEPYCNLAHQTKLIMTIVGGQKPARALHPIQGSEQFVNEIWGLIDRCYTMNHVERPSMDEVISELRRIRLLAMANTADLGQRTAVDSPTI